MSSTILLKTARPSHREETTVNMKRTLASNQNQAIVRIGKEGRKELGKRTSRKPGLCDPNPACAPKTLMPQANTHYTNSMGVATRTDQQLPNHDKSLKRIKYKIPLYVPNDGVFTATLNLETLKNRVTMRVVPLLSRHTITMSLHNHCWHRRLSRSVIPKGSGSCHGCVNKVCKYNM